jgi:hypothetical protein
MTTRDTLAYALPSERPAELPGGLHLQVLYAGADQDSWDQHIICHDLRGQEWAVEREALRL